jgi:hypothetical protein
VLIGVGLASLPWRGVGLACLGAMAIGGTVIGPMRPNPDMSLITAQLDRGVGRDDVVLVHPSVYFIVLYYSGPEVAQRVHVVAPRSVVWFWGTAGFLPGTIVPAAPVPAGTIYVIPEVGHHPPPQMPAGFTFRDSTCTESAGCLLTYAR